VWPPRAGAWEESSPLPLGGRSEAATRDAPEMGARRVARDSGGETTTFSSAFRSARPQVCGKGCIGKWTSWELYSDQPVCIIC
jgi:hypothetical protein